MHVTIHRESLEAALVNLRGIFAATGNPTTSVLLDTEIIPGQEKSDTEFEKDIHVLKLSSHDLNTHLVQVVPCEIKAEGSTLLDGKTLLGLAKTIGVGSMLTIRPKAKRFELLAGNGSAAIAPADGEHAPFPSIVAPGWVIPTAALMRAFTSTEWSIHDGKYGSPALRTLHLMTNGPTELAAEAACPISYMVSKIPAEMEHHGSHELNVCLPLQFVQMVIKLKIPDEIVHLAVDDKVAILSWGGGRLSTTIVSTQFPDLRRIEPEDKMHFEVRSANLSAALAPFKPIGALTANVRVNREHSTVTVSGASLVGDTTTTIEATSVNTDMKFAVTPETLQNAVDNLACDIIDFQLEAVGKPMRLCNAAEDAEWDRHAVIMPRYDSEPSLTPID